MSPNEILGSQTKGTMTNEVKAALDYCRTGRISHGQFTPEAELLVQFCEPQESLADAASRILGSEVHRLTALLESQRLEDLRQFEGKVGP